MVFLDYNEPYDRRTMKGLIKFWIVLWLAPFAAIFLLQMTGWLNVWMMNHT